MELVEVLKDARESRMVDVSSANKATVGALPTVTNLYEQIKKWVIPLEGFGFLIGPLNPKETETTGKKNKKKYHKKDGRQSVEVNSQQINFVLGRRVVFGAKGRVDMLIGAKTITLLLSVKGEQEGWVVLDGLQEASVAPRFVVFNEAVFLDLVSVFFV
ncbi:hypothetical protein KRR23_12045 [Pseudomonas sp. CVAP|nr:hypothetical protein [Pseudomonas sp. CVAP\